MTLDRYLGTLYGAAFGDALGRPTEFLKTAELRKFGSPFSPRVGIHNRQMGIVTDDTQMSIAVAHAAMGRYPADPADLAEQFVRYFTLWYDDPASHDGQRAPGMTCITAVSKLKTLANPQNWAMASQPHSKGNGANMRVHPLALRTDWSWETMAGAAQLQAAITHGHPTALAAADLTAYAVRLLLTGWSTPGEELITDLLEYARTQQRVYHGAWLGHAWDAWIGQGVVSPTDYIARGWREMINALLSIYGRARNPKQDPCLVAGDGWVAEEALAAALHTVACFPDDPVGALRRAAFTNGDSDSIATITGALLGAAHGLSAFPQQWASNIEYAPELRSLARMTHKAATR